jgi:hypothetical protein
LVPGQTHILTVNLLGSTQESSVLTFENTPVFITAIHQSIVCIVRIQYYMVVFSAIFVVNVRPTIAQECSLANSKGSLDLGCAPEVLVLTLQSHTVKCRIIVGDRALLVVPPIISMVFVFLYFIPLPLETIRFKTFLDIGIVTKANGYL